MKKKAIFYNVDFDDNRLKVAVSKLPHDDVGTKLDVEIDGDTGEEYELWIHESSINIKASSPAGTFYAIQTLRQIFKQKKVPCLYIKDKPDFPYRGFYQCFEDKSELHRDVESNCADVQK